MFRESTSPRIAPLSEERADRTNLSPVRWRGLRDALPYMRRVSDGMAGGQDQKGVVVDALQALARLASGGQAVLLVGAADLDAITGEPRSGPALDLAPGVRLVVEGAEAQLIRDWEGNDRPVLLDHGTKLLLPLPAGGAAILNPATGVLHDRERIEAMLILLGLALGAVQSSTQLYEAHRRSQELEETRHRLREQALLLGELAVVDDLTGLHNRRYLERRLEYELERLQRYGQALSFAILDLDRFRAVNETWGPQVGDAILTALAGLGRDAVRRADLLARYGGEAFGLLMPETDADGARLAVERLRERIACAVFPLDGAEIRLTASAGIASVTSGWPGDIESLVRFADQALFRAKQDGRDRVCFASPTETSTLTQVA